MTYGNLRAVPISCWVHPSCFVIHCETCGDIGGHYTDIDLTRRIAAAHEKAPHEIKKDKGR